MTTTTTTASQEKDDQNKRNELSKAVSVDFAGNIFDSSRDDKEEESSSQIISVSCSSEDESCDLEEANNRPATTTVLAPSYLNDSLTKSHKTDTTTSSAQDDDHDHNTKTTPTVMFPQATITIVETLDEYQGDSIAEQVESFIAAHPVVMFSKTWCLFSLDAQDFLTNIMNVSVHVLEADVHPQGKAILKHVQTQTKHRTVPIIYVQGTFLGGFEDVNQMYATGELQSTYLAGLSQADRCEEFLTKSKSGKEPFFWFPTQVNAHVVRVTGAITCLCSLVAAIAGQWQAWAHYLGYALFIDFVPRLLGGAKWSVLGTLAMLLTKDLEPKLRHGRPKQFATLCGVLFSGLGSLFFLLGSLLSLPWACHTGTALFGGLAMASGMEGFLDFCVGCLIFKWGMRLGLIPK